jgi:transcriptional regulator with XRE-family HTH domain
MKERIIEFLRAENKSSAQFADEIGVQPSGISHIISGRNKPSLDFVIKMLEKYRYISTEWLLFGKGGMYREPVMQSLFEQPMTEPSETVSAGNPEAHDHPRNDDHERVKAAILPVEARVNATRIVFFYDDNTFREYTPGK